MLACFQTRPEAGHELVIQMPSFPSIAAEMVSCVFSAVDIHKSGGIIVDILVLFFVHSKPLLQTVVEESFVSTLQHVRISWSSRLF